MIRRLFVISPLGHFLNHRCLAIDVTTRCCYIDSVKFEWDEAKRRTNIKKHGIDFADLEPLFDGETVTILDDRSDYGEERVVTLGLLRGAVLAIVHTESREVIRFISARKATKYEERSYFAQIAN